MEIGPELAAEMKKQEDRALRSEILATIWDGKGSFVDGTKARMNVELALITNYNGAGVYHNLSAERNYLALRKLAIEAGADISSHDEIFINSTGLLVTVDQRAKTLLGEDFA